MQWFDYLFVIAMMPFLVFAFIASTNAAVRVEAVFGSIGIALVILAGWGALHLLLWIVSSVW